MHGTFTNGDAYVIMHASATVPPAAAAGAVTRMLYYWVGGKATMDKATVACIKAVELRRALGGSCTISREDEAQESPDFLWLFGGEVRVMEGSAA
ncbi:unnamed protein product, partial [Phaeothamnion confervicola]